MVTTQRIFTAFPAAVLLFLAVILGCMAAGTGEAAAFEGNGSGRHHMGTHSDYNRGYGRTLRSDQGSLTLRSFRDPRGNLTMTGGRPAHWGGGVGQGARTIGGGTGGVGVAGGFGQVTSLVAGNMLNVHVEGSYNTVVVDATQVNTGDLTGTIQLSR